MGRLQALTRLGLLAVLLVNGAGPAPADEPAKPPWQRYLQGEDARQAAGQEKELAQLRQEGRLTDALKVAEALAELRRHKQGADHWQAINARAEAEMLRRVLRQPEQGQKDHARSLDLQRQATELLNKGRFREAQPLLENVLALRRKVLGEEHPHTAAGYNNLAYIQQAQGKYNEAAEGHRKALAIRRKVLGEEHPDTAASYTNVAVNQNAQGKYAEAEVGLRRALAIYRKVLGEEHPSTILGFNNLAGNQNAQGKYAAAEEGLRRALTLRRKVLGEEHPDMAASYNNLAANQQAQGKYTEAEEGLRKALAIRRKALGEEHPDTGQGYYNLAANRQAQGKYAEAKEGYEKALAIRRKVLGEEHPDTALSYSGVANNLNAQGKYAAAEEVYKKALAICRKVLGEEHPQTAQCYTNLAANQTAQGKYSEAEEGHRKGLAIFRKLLGEDHPFTAAGYNSLAVSQKAQGKYAEAEEGYRKALAIRRKALGEDHPDTAASYNNLAANQEDQGKYAAAEEGFRKALAICRKALGEEHPQTATSYNNLAHNQQRQGKYAAAEEGFRKALAIQRKVLGEEHPDTAIGHNNLAGNQQHQGRYAAAEEGHRKALALFRKVLGEEHPQTAAVYDNLARNLQEQGKFAEAEEGHRKALAICRKVLGEEHPQTAAAYYKLALDQYDQGKYTEAEEGFRKALAIRRKVLGEEHPLTFLSYKNLAFNRNAQGKYAEAEALWLRADSSFAKARLRIAASGLDRATITGERSPLPALAAVLARNNKPEQAWQRFEESLARGTWDDLSARLRRPAAEQAKQADIVNRLDRLDRLIENTLSASEDTAERKAPRNDLLSRRRQVQEELDALARHLEEAYGPAAGQVFGRKQIQKGLPADTALVGWLDLHGDPQAADPNGEHWAVLLRPSGEPVWVRLSGSGDRHAWTDADAQLPGQLCVALQSAGGKWQPLAKRLGEQRLGPLAGHLDGVRRLVVLPAPALAGVPVEVFAEGTTVSYALSGTLYAHLRDKPRTTSSGLLALADPVFDAQDLAERPRPLPAGGVLLTMVVPGSSAARAGLRPGDVLLRYNGTDLGGPADFQALPGAEDRDQRVPVTVWREGKTFDRQLPRGKLGVVTATEPAPQALAQQRKLDRRLVLLTRGNGRQWQQLPGTRFEAESLRRLFGDEPSTKLLLDSEASEQQLHELASTGTLGKYRYLHLASHGEMDNAFPLRSALILSCDELPDPGKQLEAGLPVYDGRLTAEEVLRQWHLDSDLVTLSACQTALGRYERGEGFVGFAQALILAGSRSVCLSLWKVDDTATALLMQRFYQNLLGKREGLKGPLPRAEALAEAKAWLRNLPGQEAVKQAARLSEGVSRGKGRKVQPLLVETAGKEEGERPFAHPYYWAAFVLIGQAE
jgi:tetratricopeptide (TPR) repeat protein